MDSLITRIKIFKPTADEKVLGEIVTIIQDRIKLILSIEDGTELPSSFNSILVEATVQLFNRHTMNHEGVESESVEGFSIKFVDDVLKQYEREFKEYRDTQLKKSGRGKVKFI